MRAVTTLLCAALVGATTVFASPSPLSSSHLRFTASGAALIEETVENLVNHAVPHVATSTPTGDDPLQGMLSGAGFNSNLRIELPYRPDEASVSGISMTVEEQIAAFNEKSGGKHAVLAHEEFPQLSVRIKRISRRTADSASFKDPDIDKSDPKAFCDPTVTSWSGYIDTIDGKSLFFYFFESRDSPEKDPVLLWTNGGPGGSSALGLFEELGPCRIPLGSTKTATGPPINGTEWNPFSWNSRASTIFIDQPVGVGFARSRYGIEVSDTETAAKDIYRFLRIFFAAFDKFKDSGLILAGESYGGRYIPIFATEVVDRNLEYTDAAFAQGKKPRKDQLLDLKSVMIGNGLTDTATQVPYWYDFACTTRGGLKTPILSIKTCTRMKVYRDKCAKELPVHCKMSYNADKCQDLVNLCLKELEEPFEKTGRNPYYAEHLCAYTGLGQNSTSDEDKLCYPVMTDLKAYLDRDDVRKLLGVDPVSKTGNFSLINMKLHDAFVTSHDWNLANERNLGLLLERGIRVLIYVGEKDYICNHLGNHAMVKEIDWARKGEFEQEKLYKWRVNGKVAGETQHGGGLTWATIADAGHMSPYEKPAEAQAMFHRWLDAEPF